MLFFSFSLLLNGTKTEIDHYLAVGRRAQVVAGRKIKIFDELYAFVKYSYALAKDMKYIRYGRDIKVENETIRVDLQHYYYGALHVLLKDQTTVRSRSFELKVLA